MPRTRQRTQETAILRRLGMTPRGNEPGRLRGHWLDLVDTARELEERAPEERIRLGEHERRAAVERADRAAVLVHDLVLDGSL